MNAQLLQDVLVTAIVGTSTVVVLRRLAPARFRRMQTGMAHFLGQPQRGAIARAIGRWLQPDEARKGACGSGLGCGSCSGCGPSEMPAGAIPLVIRPRSKQG
jgi:hypothetical protein